MLVNVQEHSLASSNPAVDVLSMDDLVKMAEKNNSVILHESQGTIHNYFLQDNQITYRFSIGNGKNQNFVPGRSQISDDLRQGIERGEFKVYYQPIVSLIDGKISGIEALLRWQRPQSGLTTAQEFILACEATGLIDVIGEWMLQVACAQFKEWRLKDPNLTLAVNFSKRQLEGDPVKLITHALLNSGLHPESLQIDVPESYVTQDISAILPTLHKLQNLGIRMSLDHYSGSSTISPLQQLPFSSVKIDRHIIEDINNENTVEKLKTLIANARHYGINIIAEGVETEEQLNFLRSHAINQAQGYLLGRPMPAQEISAVLQEKKGISSNGILGRFVGS
jgi:EAL domain-containing protein (putative c-di-GMP-specific phosphodiesterase class I)